MKKLLILLLLLPNLAFGANYCWIEKNPDYADTYLICWNEIDLFLDKEGNARKIKNVYCNVFGPNLDVLSDALVDCNGRKKTK